MKKNSVLSLSKNLSDLVVSTDNASINYSLEGTGVILGLFQGQLSVSARENSGNGVQDIVKEFPIENTHLFISYDQENNQFLIGTSDIDASLTGHKTINLPVTIYSLKDKSTIEIWKENNILLIKYHIEVLQIS